MTTGLSQTESIAAQKRSQKTLTKASSLIIIALVAFGIGFAIGEIHAINKCITTAEQLLDISIKPWVKTEIYSRLGGTDWYGNTSMALG